MAREISDIDREIDGFAADRRYQGHQDWNEYKGVLERDRVQVLNSVNQPELLASLLSSLDTKKAGYENQLFGALFCRSGYESVRNEQIRNGVMLTIFGIGALTGVACIGAPLVGWGATALGASGIAEGAAAVGGASYVISNGAMLASSGLRLMKAYEMANRAQEDFVEGKGSYGEVLHSQRKLKEEQADSALLVGQVDSFSKLRAATQELSYFRNGAKALKEAGNLERAAYFSKMALACRKSAFRSLAVTTGLDVTGLGYDLRKGRKLGATLDTLWLGLDAAGLPSILKAP